MNSHNSRTIDPSELRRQAAAIGERGAPLLRQANRLERLTARVKHAYDLHKDNPIICAVAKKFRIPVWMIFQRDSSHHAALPRHVAMYLLHSSGLSYPQVGRLLGRDSSTCVHDVAQLRRRMRSREFARLIKGIREAVDEGSESR